MIFNDNVSKILAITRFLLPTLSPSEKKAAEYLLANPLKVTKMPLVKFAKHSDSSQASIIRLCQRMGLSGFAELKSSLAIQLVIEENISTGIDGSLKNKLGSNMIEIIDQVFNVNIRILKETFALASNEYNRAYDAILKAKRIGFYAIGDAMIPCQFALFKFRRIGYDCFAETDPDLQVINACNLTKGDVAIAVSHTGNTRQVNGALEIAHNNGATTIGITKREKSEMIKHCDILIFTATPDMNVGQEVVARRVAEQAILEALYFGILQSREPDSLNKIKSTSDAMKLNKN